MLIKTNFTNVNFAQVKSVDLTYTFYLTHYIDAYPIKLKRAIVKRAPVKRESS